MSNSMNEFKVVSNDNLEKFISALSNEGIPRQVVQRVIRAGHREDGVNNIFYMFAALQVVGWVYLNNLSERELSAIKAKQTLLYGLDVEIPDEIAYNILHGYLIFMGFMVLYNMPMESLKVESEYLCRKEIALAIINVAKLNDCALGRTENALVIKKAA